MKKNNNKKGFTIVELVIVIAVIAILAAVLIPTFSGVINSANESKALQQATALYKDAYAVAISDGKIETEVEVEVEVEGEEGEEGTTETKTIKKAFEIHQAGDLYFAFVSTDGSIDADKVTVTVYNAKPEFEFENAEAAPSAPAGDGKINGYPITVEDGVVKVGKKS